MVADRPRRSACCNRVADAGKIGRLRLRLLHNYRRSLILEGIDGALCEKHMKSTSASPGYFTTLSFQFPRWSFSLRVAAIVVLLAGVNAQGRPAQAAPAEPAPAHGYLIRRALNIFSLGIDQSEPRLHKTGTTATVHNHMLWASIADDAAAEYKSGRVKTIILVGHSSGATV